MSLWLEQKRMAILGKPTGPGLSAAMAFMNKGASVMVVGPKRYQRSSLSAYVSQLTFIPQQL